MVGRSAWPPLSARSVARAQGVFYVASGVWPLIHFGSFEAVTGPKTDRWLVQTVSGLLMTNGLAQLAWSGAPEGRRVVGVIGAGTAGTLAAIDLLHAPRGRIRRVYLLDAAAELAWLAAWLAAWRAADGRAGDSTAVPG